METDEEEYSEYEDDDNEIMVRFIFFTIIVTIIVDLSLTFFYFSIVNQ